MFPAIPPSVPPASFHPSLSHSSSSSRPPTKPLSLPFTSSGSAERCARIMGGKRDRLLANARGIQGRIHCTDDDDDDDDGMSSDDDGTDEAGRGDAPTSANSSSPPSASSSPFKPPNPSTRGDCTMTANEFDGRDEYDEYGEYLADAYLSELPDDFYDDNDDAAAAAAAEAEAAAAAAAAAAVDAAEEEARSVVAAQAFTECPFCRGGPLAPRGATPYTGTYPGHADEGGGEDGHAVVAWLGCDACHNVLALPAFVRLTPSNNPGSLPPLPFADPCAAPVPRNPCGCRSDSHVSALPDATAAASLTMPPPRPNEPAVLSPGKGLHAHAHTPSRCRGSGSGALYRRGKLSRTPLSAARLTPPRSSSSSGSSSSALSWKRAEADVLSCPLSLASVARARETLASVFEAHHLSSPRCPHAPAFAPAAAAGAAAGAPGPWGAGLGTGAAVAECGACGFRSGVIQFSLL